MEQINQSVLLKNGSRGSEVETLQRILKKLDLYDGFIDGHFGGGTQSAVVHYQRSESLTADGIVGKSTIQSLNSYVSTLSDVKHLSVSDLQWAAKELGCELAAIKAVDRIESNGDGFNNDGTLKIRYERHIMARRLKKRGLTTLLELAQKHLRFLVDGKPIYTNSVQSVEHDKLNQAAGLNRNAAYESISMGRYQIMGFHAELLGYKNAEEMFKDFSKGERQQLEGFVKFIKADRSLQGALIRKEWAAFARGYNGPSYAKNQYDVKLNDAYHTFLV